MRGSIQKEATRTKKGRQEKAATLPASSQRINRLALSDTKLKITSTAPKLQAISCQHPQPTFRAASTQIDTKLRKRLPRRTARQSYTPSLKFATQQLIASASQVSIKTQVDQRISVSLILPT